MDSLHSRQSFCSLCWLPQESPESQQVNSSQAVVMCSNKKNAKSTIRIVMEPMLKASTLQTPNGEYLSNAGCRLS